jgi:hypothetical protein
VVASTGVTGASRRQENASRVHDWAHARFAHEWGIVASARQGVDARADSRGFARGDWRPIGGTTTAERSGKRFASSPGMRGRALVVLALMAVLPACTTLRERVPQEATPMIAAPAMPTTIDCVEHPAIDSWAERMQSQPRLRDTIADSLARGAAYLPALRAIITSTGLPEQLALLPAIESGFRANARGRFGDVGLWQLRRPAARRFGLTVTRRRDDRLHPEHATRAAARYLDFLYGRYGDWPLALAAYNAGEGRVDRAMAAAGYDSFWELADEGWLPATCRDYVPRFLALIRVTQGRGHCDVGQRVAAAY